MCFETTKNARAKIAKTDIECWKLLFTEWCNKRMASICELYEYKEGEINPHVILRKKNDTESSTGIGIRKGYHSFRSKKLAENSLYDSHDVYKFIIPAGTRYYENETEYVSETIKLVE